MENLSKIGGKKMDRVLQIAEQRIIEVRLRRTIILILTLIGSILLVLFPVNGFSGDKDSTIVVYDKEYHRRAFIRDGILYNERWEKKAYLRDNRIYNDRWDRKAEIADLCGKEER
jgi:hypothetical protein